MTSVDFDPFSREFFDDPFATYEQFLDSGRFPFPVGEDARDPRLAPSALVIGISVEDTTSAYPIDDLTKAINDEVNGRPIVILPTEGGASAYSPIVDGETLVFTAVGDVFEDTATRSIWESTGQAVAGPLEGTTLEALPSRTTFWFALVGAFPDVELVR